MHRRSQGLGFRVETCSEGYAVFTVSAGRLLQGLRVLKANSIIEIGIVTLNPEPNGGYSKSCMTLSTQNIGNYGTIVRIRIINSRAFFHPRDLYGKLSRNTL